MKKIVLTLITSLALSGCAGKFFDPPHGQNFSDPIDLTFAYIDWDSNILISDKVWALHGESSKVKNQKKLVKNMPYGHDLQTCFSSRLAIGEHKATIKARYQELCTSLGGQYEDPWCRKGSARLFFAQAWFATLSPSDYDPRDPDGSRGACVRVVTPMDNGGVNSENWINWTHQSIETLEAKRLAEEKKVALMYQKQREQAELLQKQQQERQIKLEKAEKARQKIETPIILSTKGLNICKKVYKEKDYPVYSGYVEDVAKPRIKILISELLIKPHYKDATFTPSLIWDLADNWYICE